VGRQLLNDHPDQRRELVDKPVADPQALEEILRCEPRRTLLPLDDEGHEFHGTTIPAGSIVVVLPPAANRDEDKWDDSERFDIHREPAQIFTFGFGPHFCLGANLARLEARLALEAILPRINEWTVDYDGATLYPGSDTRGWQQLPVTIG